MTIWTESNGPKHIRPISETLWRLVENQESTITSSFVDDLDEALILEQLLDDSKPSVPLGVEGLHFLLKTPFRYPPLEWGSRFGREFEPSLFYGGQSPEVVLWEVGFYRLAFFDAMEQQSPDIVRTTHSLFSVNYATERGIQLQHAPFSEFFTQLTHPTDYNPTQPLGSDMCEAGVLAFEYPSARDPEHRINVGLYEPTALADQMPRTQESVICDTSYNRVEFLRTDCRCPLVRMNKADFLVNGEFPSLA